MTSANKPGTRSSNARRFQKKTVCASKQETRCETGRGFTTRPPNPARPPSVTPRDAAQDLAEGEDLKPPLRLRCCCGGPAMVATWRWEAPCCEDCARAICARAFIADSFYWPELAKLAAQALERERVQAVCDALRGVEVKSEVKTDPRQLAFAWECAS